MDGWLGLKNQLVDAEADQLGDTQPRGKRQMEHGPVAHAIAARGVRHIEHRLPLLVRQVADQWLIGFLRGDGQQHMDLLDTGDDAVLKEAGEGLDGGKPRVAGAGRVAASRLKIVEKCKDERDIKLFEHQCGGLRFEPPCGEGQQQLERIGIRVAGMDAGLALSGEPLAENAVR